MNPETPRIELPADLRPKDGRFGSGPSKVRPEALAALAGTGRTYLGTSHRQDRVRSVIGRLRAGLTQLFSLPDGYEVVLGNGGATAFWDAATFGLIERRSQHLVFGEFSSKFAAAVTRAPHLLDPEVVESPPGTRPDPIPNADVDVYAITHCETSTGVAMDVMRPPGDGLVLVDATSAAGGMRVDPRQFDAYYFSPQKCFGADAGLWVALVSPYGVERIGRLATERWAPASLNLQIAVANSRLDQTYNTPALATLFLFVHQVEWMLAGGGLEWAASRCDRSAEVVYTWAEESPVAAPFVERASDRSRTVATVDLDESVDARVVSQVLRTNGILDTESYRKLGRNQLRIGMFPAIEPDDVATLTRAVEYVVGRMVGGV